MLILNHAKDESKSEKTQAYEDQRKKLEEAFGGKAKYGDGKHEDPSTLIPLPPSSPRGDIRDLPSTAPPPGTPSWCPPPKKRGSPPPEKIDTECIY